MILQNIIEKASNWEDIYNNLITQHHGNLSKAGKDFEQFAKLYFLCEPSVCNDFQNIWLFSEVPLKTKEKLGLGNKDYGIDLILEDREGHLHVVQCKFKQDQNASLSWTKDRLANTLADGDKADFFIIFTNASSIDKYTLSKKKNKLRVFTLGDLIHLTGETIEAMKLTLLDRQPKLQPKKSPNPHQEIAIHKTIEGFKQNDRGQLILPCGTGKTLISLWIQEHMNPNYTLVLFPSLALLRQTKNEWSANRKHYVPYICVCSEKDIDKKGDSTQTNLCEISGYVSTDPIEIKEYLHNHKQTIVFSTYQSLDAVAEAIKDTDIVFDLAICDEAHKTAGSKKGLYGLIHDDSKIRIKKRLYMTATPRVLGENIKNRLNEEEVGYLANMNDPKTFGPEFHHMSFKEAIDQDILVDYKIIAMGVSDAEVAALIKERRYVSDEVTADEIANNYALEKFMREHQAAHVITFHSSVAKAQSFKERHEERFTEVETFHVNGKQTTNDRNVILKAFEESSKSVVTNARCLTEGVDIPVIDAVYFCDPKNSKIDIVQAAGRALRRANYRGKKLGYVVVPIFHHNKDKVEDAIEEGVFNNLISVIRSLSSHDERLLDEIRAIKLGKGSRQIQSDHIAIEGVVNLIKIEGMGDLSEHLFDQVISKFRLPWKSFEEAREFVHTLNLKSKKYWENYCRTGEKPKDIPSKPRESYKYHWQGWGNWLGTGRIADQLKQYRSFEEAKKFIHTLNLKNREEWKAYCDSGEKPEDIPKTPEQVYKDKGWISWGDWLGNGRITPEFKSFEEAKTFVHRLKLRNVREWNKYHKDNKPEGIPSNPQRRYKNKGWMNWGDWLGTGKIGSGSTRSSWRNFEEAREFVHNLKLKNGDDWREYSKSIQKPHDIPASPERTYKDKGWSSWGDWLSTGSIASYNRKFLPYEEAKKFVYLLNLQNNPDWVEYVKSGIKPDNIPAAPQYVYKDKGWSSWGEWLGTGSIASFNRKFLPYEKARKFVYDLGLKSRTEWLKYVRGGKKPDNIPATPNHAYKGKGWGSWGEWLGTGSIASFNRKFLPYEEAKKFVHDLGLKSGTEWKKYIRGGKKPNNIPADPSDSYRNKGWISINDWLGTSK